MNEDIKFNGVYSHIDAAITHVQNTIRYERIQDHGPKHLVVSRDDPLVTRWVVTILSLILV